MKLETYSMKHSRRHGGWKGFTLIELLIAISILASTFIVIAASLQISRVARRSARGALAYSIASSLLEATADLSYSELTTRATGTPLGIFPPQGIWSVRSDTEALSASNTLALSGTSTAVSGIAGALRIPTNALTDFTAEAAMKAAPDAPDDWRVGIIFRASDYEHFYRYSLSGDELLLTRVQGATTTELWSQPVTLATSTWYRAKVAASGDDFTLFLNDNQYAVVSDDVYASGILAISSGGAAMDVDDVIISSPGSLTWNFDGEQSGVLPSGWRRPWVVDLPGGIATLTIEEWNGLSGIKKITAAVTWGEESDIKRVELTTLRSQY